MIGLDIETTALDPREGEIRLVQVAEGDRVDVYDTHLQEFSVIQNVVGDVSRGRGDLVAHNARFERDWIWQHFGIDLGAIHDTMIMSQVLYTGTAHGKNVSHSLANVARRVLEVELDKEQQTSDWGGELTEEQIIYAAKDAYILPGMAEKLLDRLEDEGLSGAYDLERRLAPAVGAMEDYGIAVDREKLEQFITANTVKAGRLRAELEAEWGINPGSTKQLREYFGLDTREGWPKTAKGAAKTDQGALKTLAGEYPAISKWLEWKKVEKLRSTYGTSLQKKIDADGRIRARFNPFGADSGRFSSSSPNLQNIPHESEIRAMFVAPEGRVLITADYKNIEVWIAAIRWRDGRMMKVLREGLDIHAATAAAIYGKAIEDVTSEERAVGKTANFALLYGAGAPRLLQQFKSRDIEITEREAEKIYSTFFKTYRGFAKKRYGSKEGFYGGEYREARTAIGRRRTYAAWQGPLMNHEIQGTGADGLKYALARMYEDRRSFPEANPVATVHDEIVVEANKEGAEDVEAWVVEHMVAGMVDAMAPYADNLPSDPEVETIIAPVWTKA